jgi:ABC-type transport system involved in multi-copper enzyme maturation permease subunit
MPVFEQGYRRYVGEKSTKSRAFIIAWQNVRPRMRWWVWALLLVLIGPYYLYGVLIFVTTIGAGLVGGPGPRTAVEPSVAFERTSAVNPATVLALVQGGSLSLYWELLDHASYAAVIFPAVVGAGLLASDRRTGALQIYFSRPVSRLDYLNGKILAATGLVALTTAVPSLLVWIETVAFGSSANFTWQTWVAPFVVVGASAFYALWAVALVLSLSSVMSRPAFAGTVAIVIHVMLEGIGAILGRTLDKSWTVLQPSHAIGTLTAPLCGLGVPDWISPVAAFGIGFVLPIGLLALVWWRIKAVEVST